MTQDDVVRMAREAGFETKVLNSIDGEEVVCFDPLITDMLKDFAILVAANEREACANQCEKLISWLCIGDDWASNCLKTAAAAIRQQGEK